MSLDISQDARHHEVHQLPHPDTGLYRASTYTRSPSLRFYHSIYAVLIRPRASSQLTFCQIYIDTPLPITADLLNIPFLPSAGTLISEPDYRPALRATFVHGSDFLRRDSDGQIVRLDVTSVARDATGALLRFNYNGVVGMTGDEGKIIRGDVNATTTGFGNACEWTLWWLSLQSYTAYFLLALCF